MTYSRHNAVNAPTKRRTDTAPRAHRNDAITIISLEHDIESDANEEFPKEPTSTSNGREIHVLVLVVPALGALNIDPLAHDACRLPMLSLFGR